MGAVPEVVLDWYTSKQQSEKEKTASQPSKEYTNNLATG